MPTVFSHAFFAAAAGKGWTERPLGVWFWLLAVLCSIVPDADVAAFAFGIPYDNMFGHRGFTHSIAFAVLFGALAAFVAEKFMRTGLSFGRLFLFFSLATFSHPVLDMLTDGGLGVALFAPLSNERFFFPVRPVEVSPIGLRFFGARGVEVILSEIVWVWLPALALFSAGKLVRRFGRKDL